MSVTAHDHWKINEICIANEGNTYILLEDRELYDSGFTHGISKKGQLCLSLKEAKQLLSSLTSAIDSYEDIERLVQQSSLY